MEHICQTSVGSASLAFNLNTCDAWTMQWKNMIVLVLLIMYQYVLRKLSMSRIVQEQHAR